MRDAPPCAREVIAMNPIPWISRLTCALGVLAGPTAAWAQSPPGSLASPVPAPPEAAQGGALGIVLLIVGLLVVVGISVKLYDYKRKRDEQGLVLQARLSDALLLDSSLAGLPVVATVTTPLWGRSLSNVTVSGTVPSAELRDAALRIVKREVTRFPDGARIEDRVVVDPLMFKHVA
jgi:hypothetical protein